MTSFADYLLGPLIRRGQRTVIGGASGHGKTTFALHMLAAAVYGRRFLDWTVLGDLRALVVDVGRGDSTKRVLREVGLKGPNDLDPRVVPHIVRLRTPHPSSLDTDPVQIEAMEEIFNRDRFDVVMVDPLYACSAAGALMRRFEDWQERFGFALILPMHCDRPRPHAQLSVSDLYGSSYHQRTAEVIVGLERPTKAGLNFRMLHWWQDKGGDLPPIDSHWDLMFDRETGFRHTIQRKKATLDEQVYGIVKDHGPVTRGEINHQLGQFAVRMPTLDRALARLGAWVPIGSRGG